jgi:S-adenosylmethionine decarboxylase
MNALARLGMVSETPSENQTSTVSVEPAKDYFVERDGVKFAGMHLLIDLWGASNLDSPELIDETLCAGALEAGATILHSHFRHISIHTWPERNFAALDVFMCGNCNPYKVIPFLKAAFRPSTVQVGEQKRGLIA